MGNPGRDDLLGPKPMFNEVGHSRANWLALRATKPIQQSYKVLLTYYDARDQTQKSTSLRADQR